MKLVKDSIYIRSNNVLLNLLMVKRLINFFCTGDLFECEEDLEKSDLWKVNSHQPAIQEKNRREMMRIADVIIPGHGPSFRVQEKYKV